MGFADKTLWEWLQLLGALAIALVFAMVGFRFATPQEDRQKRAEILRGKSQAALSFANLSQADLSGAG
jgi:membrane protein implicated in regulation of membrane protease activity